MKENKVLILIFIFAFESINCASQKSLTNDFLEPNKSYSDFLNGHKAEFSTKDMPKANGINFTIDYPMGWIKADCTDTGNLGSFINPSLPESKTDTLDIYLEDMPELKKQVITEDFVKSSLIGVDMKALFPNYIKFISCNYSKIGGIPSVVIDAKIKESNLEHPELNQYRFLVHFVGSGQIMIVRFSILEPHGTIGDLSNVMELKKHLKAVMPVIEAMEKSIVITRNVSSAVSTGQ
jgi:hypothetical protein